MVWHFTAKCCSTNHTVVNVLDCIHERARSYLFNYLITCVDYSWVCFVHQYIPHSAEFCCESFIIQLHRGKIYHWYDIANNTEVTPYWNLRGEKMSDMYWCDVKESQGHRKEAVIICLKCESCWAHVCKNEIFRTTWRTECYLLI